MGGPKARSGDKDAREKVRRSGTARRGLYDITADPYDGRTGPGDPKLPKSNRG
ncbi:MAG: hypothetical protein Ct9H300mP1_21270 [Planctomycetaceae bacterium]|nr:MAG: hypothetical protein Ct9H300mP1_21270 [Planctomycetaceae bacterium]